MFCKKAQNKIIKEYNSKSRQNSYNIVENGLTFNTL